MSPIRPAITFPGPAARQGWLLRQKVQIDTQVPVPAAVGPEPILRGITDRGYYIWRAG